MKTRTKSPMPRPAYPKVDSRPKMVSDMAAMQADADIGEPERPFEATEPVPPDGGGGPAAEHQRQAEGGSPMLVGSSRVRGRGRCRSPSARSRQARRRGAQQQCAGAPAAGASWLVASSLATQIPPMAPRS